MEGCQKSTTKGKVGYLDAHLETEKVVKLHDENSQTVNVLFTPSASDEWKNR